jgi:hypothetical protein
VTAVTNAARTVPSRLTLIAAALAAAFTFALGAGKAEAFLLETTRDCPERPTTNPFTPWGDTFDYILAPDGAVENGAGEWTLSGGAAIVDGNSPFYSHRSTDSHSIRIPKGGTATTDTMCIGKEHPTIRFFAKNDSSSISFLDVRVEVETAWGREVTLPVGLERGNQEWEPSSAMRLVVNHLNLEPGTYTPVEFKFTARNGDWRIDDVYVDPRKH